jgi:hypothetical protein
VHEENSVERQPSKRRAAIVAALGVTALGGAVAAGVLTATSEPHSASAGKVSAASAQQAPAAAPASGSTASTAGGSAVSAAAKPKREKCTTVDRYIPYNSVIPGGRIEWHASLRYCWNGKKVRVVRASSYVKGGAVNVKEEPNAPRIVFNKKHSAATVMISSTIVKSSPLQDFFAHPKVQFRMWAINGAHTFKKISE